MKVFLRVRPFSVAELENHESQVSCRIVFLLPERMPSIVSQEFVIVKTVYCFQIELMGTWINVILM